MNKAMAILCALGAIGGLGLASRDNLKVGVVHTWRGPSGEERTVRATHLDRIGYTTVGIFCLLGFCYFVRQAREEDVASPASSEKTLEPLDRQDSMILQDMPQDGSYHRLPGTLQWNPRARQPVDKAAWKSCENCRRSIPVVVDFVRTADDRIEKGSTCTYVCPFCSHCHVGASPRPEEFQKQQTCHECGSALGEFYQCPQCQFPRGWMRVDCPYCKNRQPVLAPHWVDLCDTYRLECVQCESVFLSLCIC